jgi:light-regulated signal transduction histidine kinase (bacteriophytochrome)
VSVTSQTVNSAHDQFSSELVDRCNQIDLRRIGSVQPHGAVIVISADDRRVMAVSAQVDRFIEELSPSRCGCAASEVLGLNELFGALGDGGYQDSTGSSRRVDTFFRGRWLSVSLDEDTPAGWLLLTIELSEDARVAPGVVARHQAAIVESSDATNLWREAVRAFADITQFDRVLLYRFLPDWSGEVVAEECLGFPERYLHLRFPASDLPSSARAMYRSSRVRSIGDSFADPVPVIAQEGGGGVQFDLSASPARSVAETHRVYLRNMGVSASVSFPIQRGSDLWGLIACHHRSPRVLPHHVRQIGIELAGLISSQLLGFDAAIRMEVIHNSAHLLDRALGKILDFDALRSDDDLKSRLMSWCDGEGFAFFDGTDWRSIGAVPDEMALMAVRDIALADRSADGVIAVDDLSRFLGMEVPSSAAGMLAVVVGGGVCAWFRPEVTGQIAWAGKPDAWGGIGPEDGLLRPRHSFSRWVEERRGHSAPWTEFDRHKGVVWRAAFVRRFSIPSATW